MIMSLLDVRSKSKSPTALPIWLHNSMLAHTAALQTVTYVVVSTVGSCMPYCAFLL
jgi:hypothetical protein